MLSSIVAGLQGLTEGVAFLFTVGGLKNLVMLMIGGTLMLRALSPSRSSASATAN